MQSTQIPTVGRFNCPDAKTLMDEFRAAVPRQVLEIIETRYHGPTDTAGSCTSAVSLITSTAGQASWNYGLTQDENHLSAALEALCDSRSEWELISRQSTDDGYLFCFQYVSPEVR